MDKELLNKEVEKSRYILDLNDDWDDEGSIAYKEDTWKVATDLLIEMANIMPDIEEVPKISHGPGGSIDIFFNKNKIFKLLINVKDNSDISYYLELNNFMDNNGLFNGIINFLNSKTKNYSITSENYNLEEDKIAYKAKHHCPACNILKSGVRYKKLPKHICGK